MKVKNVYAWLTAIEEQCSQQEIKVEWANGLAQEREAKEARTEEIELEKSKPFARTRDDLLLNGCLRKKDDPIIECMLKEKVRWGDPMTHFVKAAICNRELRTAPEAEVTDDNEDGKVYVCMKINCVACDICKWQTTKATDELAIPGHMLRRIPFQYTIGW
nr:BUD13 homolog [Tanacetum cinerariifolium]